MNLTRLLFFSCAVGMALSSCQSSKIAYGNSYYFKQTPKHAATASTATVETAAVYASTETDRSFIVPTPDISETISILDEKHSETTKKVAVSRAEKKEVRQQRGAQRKAFKKELRKLADAQQDPNRDRVQGLVKAGIITGVAGAIMLLVGALTSVGFLIGLGGIFLAVGVVLILYKVL